MGGKARCKMAWIKLSSNLENGFAVTIKIQFHGQNLYTRPVYNIRILKERGGRDRYG